MDEKGFKNGRTFESVKAAINMYNGGMISQFSTTKKFHNDASYPEQRTSSKARELQLAKNRISQIDENTRIAELEKSEAEFELLEAKKLVRELTSLIEESKSRLTEFEKCKQEDGESDQGECYQYEEMTEEIEVLKRELSNIKLEMESTAEEKSRAEMEADAATIRIESYTSAAEDLRREIDEVNEEEVLVQLAQIQAGKELADIEAQWEVERERYSKIIEETHKKIDNFKYEIEKKKDLEDRLDATNCDAKVLQSELNLIREMDSKFLENEKLKNSALQSVTKELEAARKELQVAKDKGFQIMRSMDVIRKELIKISGEKGKLEKNEDETEKKLNSKLLKAKDELEFAKESEGRTKSMFLTMSVELENLVTKKTAAIKEEEELKEEMKNIKAETQKIEAETNANEERLQAVIEELEAVKLAEDSALEKLRSVAQNVARARASNTKTTIKISKFEYDYLTGGAAAAQALADKKVAAAEAWTEALKAEQREIIIKTAQAEKTIRELTVEEDQVARKMEESEKSPESTTEYLQKNRQNGKLSFEERRSMEESDYNSTQGRQEKFRRSVGSPAPRRMNASSSLNKKRKRKVMLKIAKYCANEQIENQEFTNHEGN